MRHWKSMMDRDYLFAFDLQGRDVVVEIERVTAGTIKGEGGRSAKKPVAFFSGKEKGLALNSTNCRTIASLYGDDVDRWIGRRITLYPTTTEMGGKTVDCIRVRPRIPGATRKGAPPAPPADEPQSIGADEAAEIERSEREEADRG